MDSADAPGLLQQHRRLTSRMAGHIGRSDAEDLASEAVARGIGRPAPDGRQAPWIERIFRNLVVDSVRRAGRVTASLSTMTEDPPAASPEEVLLAQERQRALLGAIPTIPLALRDALVARFFEDRDYDGVAATRGITAATARTRVHRALARLRVSLGRLRGVIPTPFAFGTQSITVAMMPAVFSASLVIPSLIGPLALPPAGAERPVVIAQSKSVSVKQKGRSIPSPVPVSVSPALTTQDPVPSATSARRVPARARPSTDAASAAVQRFNYDDDDVVGDLKRPGTEPVMGDPGRSQHVSLIEIPRSFEPALTKMLEDI